MGETFCTGDLHLNHYNVALHDRREQWIKPNPNYDPSKPKHFKYNNPECVDLEKHDNDLCDNWNSVVSKKDTVIICGDLAWKRHTHFIMRLNGKKYLIRGNHDKMSLDAYRCFAKIEEAHWQYSWPTKIYGHEVMFSHAPYLTWFSSCHGAWNIHAHCHGRSADVPHILQLDVGCMLWGYRPLHWSIIEKVMGEKEKNRKEWMKEKKRESERCDENESAQNSVIAKARNKEILNSMGINYV